VPLGTSPSGSPVYPPLSHLSARFARSAVQLDLLVGGGWKHLDLAAQGRGSIGKAIYGAVRSVRRLLVGRKTRIGVFSAAPADGRQERQEGGERELEGAEREALVQEGVAGRW
jgi:hypothetical protein